MGQPVRSSFKSEVVFSDLVKSAAFAGMLCVGLVPSLTRAQMTLPGSMGVGPTGAATYSIPIEVVPGTAGIQPKLSFGYSSQSGNGMMGVGWGLYGLSSITRCPRTKAQDGIVGSVNYDANDRFCLDGKRLNVVGDGVYGASGTEYRTEIQEFSSVVSSGAVGSGPASFVVRTKGGLRLEYGITADSQIKLSAQPSVRIWALSKVTDTSKNSMTISYVNSDSSGSYYPARIDYTRNETDATAPTAAYASVQFGYELKPEDKYHYTGGFSYRLSSRLKWLRTYYHPSATTSELVSDYRIAYEAGPYTGRSRVVSISRCGATGICLPPTKFEWSDQTKSFPAATKWNNDFAQSAGWGDEVAYPRFVADVSGDGRADTIGFASDGVYVSETTGVALPAGTKRLSALGLDNWDNSSRVPRLLADVNGDGRADIVAFGYSNTGSQAVLVALAEGTGFSSPQSWTNHFTRHKTFEPFSWDPSARDALKYMVDGGCEHYCEVPAYHPDTENLTPRHLADVNGDGRADIVGFGANGVYVSLSTGTAFGTQTAWSSSFGFKGYGNVQADYNSKTPRRFLADMNGDGMADIVEFGIDGIYVALSSGTSFGARSKWTSGFPNWAASTKRWMTVADVNGDGLNDVVSNDEYGLYVALNTGKSLLTHTKWSKDFGFNSAEPAAEAAYAHNWADLKKYPIYAIDVNDDGMSDIVGFGTSGTFVALSNGKGFVSAAPNGRWSTDFSFNAGWTDNGTMPRHFADVTGDGILDIVGFKDGVQVSARTGLPADLMTRAYSDVGTDYSVVYKSLSGVDRSYVKETTAVYPLMDYQGPAHAVQRLSWDTAVGTTSSKTYRYQGAKIGLDGRGFLGMRKVTERDERSFIETTTLRSQSFPFIGLPTVVESRYVNTEADINVRISQVINSYVGTSVASVANKNDSGKTSLVLLTKSVRTGNDLTSAMATSALPSVTSDYVYDDWGNILTQTTQTSHPTGGDYISETINTYANATGSWMIGTLLTSTTKQTAPGE
ncbi:FG-GAP-like repeat-containing protein [Lacibacterium aquatile]|uniref:FG-GAP-like repeat-containing protein n=1 Tax=Lacibacterium aquatile TaxID=1168082 RepID=A0ABW5DSQ9_9PROT